MIYHFKAEEPLDAHAVFLAALEEMRAAETEFLQIAPFDDEDIVKRGTFIRSTAEESVEDLMSIASRIQGRLKTAEVRFRMVTVDS